MSSQVDIHGTGGLVDRLVDRSKRLAVNQVLPLALVARLAQCVLWDIACLVSFKELLF